MISITVDGEAYEVPSNAADTNWAAKQLAFEQAVAEAVNTALDGGNAPTWTTATLINSWVAVPFVRAPQHTVNDAGLVTLRGMGATGASGSVMTVLPSDRRPAAVEVFATYADGGLAHININPNGNVTVTDGNSDSDVSVATSLDGISFYTT